MEHTAEADLFGFAGGDVSTGLETAYRPRAADAINRETPWTAALRFGENVTTLLLCFAVHIETLLRFFLAHRGFDIAHSRRWGSCAGAIDLEQTKHEITHRNTIAIHGGIDTTAASRAQEREESV